MSTATQGRAREYRVRDHMIAAGWTFIMRAAASKGAADLLMGHEEHGAALIQVGTLGKNLGPAERSRFLRAAHLTSALPIVARAHRTGIKYAIVHDGIPSDWEPWTP
jgi:hypothetical protein